MQLCSLRTKIGAALLVGELCAIPAYLAKNSAGPGQVIRVNLRTRVHTFKATGEWQEASVQEDVRPDQAAIIICDMWDNHWCHGAAKRVEVLARKMVPVLDVARAHGIVIIHAPSETMDYYKDYPQRNRMIAFPKANPPPPLDLARPPLPIDDADGGCDTPPDTEHKAWKSESSIIPIREGDFISDDGSEVYSLLQQRGIKSLFIMGVHTNMCVLNRTFAIRQMTEWGVSCILVRDLTDTMYNPDDSPHVAHDQGTELVIEYIEKNYCPSILSRDLVSGLSVAAAGAQKQ